MFESVDGRTDGRHRLEPHPISSPRAIDLANSADPDKMPHFKSFYLSLNCLSKYTSTKRFKA